MHLVYWLVVRSDERRVCLWDAMMGETRDEMKVYTSEDYYRDVANNYKIVLP